MTLRKLKKRDDGNFSCPACGSPLRFKDGETVAVVSGQIDMDNYKPRYICDDCKVYYRAVLTTDYYDVFPLGEDAEAKPEPETAVKEPVDPYTDFEKQLIDFGLQDIAEVDSTIGVKMVYATPDNFLGHVLYHDLNHAFMVPAMAQSHTKEKSIHPQ